MSFERAYVFCGLCKDYFGKDERLLRDVARNNTMSALEAVEASHMDGDTRIKAGIILNFCMICEYKGEVAKLLDDYKKGHKGHLPGRFEHPVKRAEKEEEEPMTETQIIRAQTDLLKVAGEPEESFGCTEIRRELRETGNGESEIQLVERKIESPANIQLDPLDVIDAEADGRVPDKLIEEIMKANLKRIGKEEPPNYPLADDVPKI